MSLSLPLADGTCGTPQLPSPREPVPRNKSLHVRTDGWINRSIGSASLESPDSYDIRQRPRPGGLGTRTRMTALEWPAPVQPPFRAPHLSSPRLPLGGAVRAFCGSAAAGRRVSSELSGGWQQLRAEPPPRRTVGEETQPSCESQGQPRPAATLLSPAGPYACLGSQVAGPTGALALYCPPETSNPQTD